MTRRIQRTILSDGREAIFFHDSDDSAVPVAEDPRRGLQRPDNGKLRFDMLTGEWVAVATHRQSRTHLPSAVDCPLCPSTPGNATEIPAENYDVVVFENRFPSLGPGLGEVPADPTDLAAEVLSNHLGAASEEIATALSAPGYGRCEVIVFAPDHEGSFTALEPRRARTVVDAWVNRTIELSQLPGIEQVFVFENRGENIGVTMHHPHGQIYAYPYVTPHTAHLSARAEEYHKRTGRPLMGDILLAEQRAERRMVISTEHFSAYVPFAARWPVEVHLVPHRQVGTLAELTEAEKDDLARTYLELLRRVDGLYATPTPYIAAWHQAPVNCLEPDAQWLHLEITSPRRAENKLKYLAGSESAMGAFINDVSAEETAQRLREVDPARGTHEGEGQSER